MAVIHSITYSVHEGSFLSRRTRLPVFLLHEIVASFSAADQLLILPPAWRAGPSPIPPPRVDPISLRVQAPSHLFVSHSCHPNIFKTKHGWASVSRKLMLASAFQHPSFQSGSGPKKMPDYVSLIQNRTDSCIVYYFNSGTIPDAGQSRHSGINTHPHF